MFVNSLYNSHVCGVLVSEERDEPIIVEESKAGKYCVAFDPLGLKLLNISYEFELKLNSFV